MHVLATTTRTNGDVNTTTTSSSYMDSVIERLLEIHIGSRDAVTKLFDTQNNNNKNRNSS
jgi:hypothetical protein